MLRVRIGGETIPYVRTFRAGRSIRVTVRPGGEVAVNAPKRIPQHMVDAFMSERAAWLMRAYERQRKLQPKLSAKEARALYAQHKERARALVHKRLAHFNTHYRFQYRAVAIRDQRTRWGSCSRKGNLNFSYKLALMRPEVADYVIVHELCHLREFNHSSRFWALVAETVPNYNALRKELRAGALM